MKWVVVPFAISLAILVSATPVPAQPATEMPLIRCPVPITLPALFRWRSMQQDMGELIEDWTKRGLNLGFGVGIPSGYTTLGHIGTEEQFHYTAIGLVENLSSRLCDQAKSGEILTSEPVYAEAEDFVDVEPGGEFTLKGFPMPVSALRVTGVKD